MTASIVALLDEGREGLFEGQVEILTPIVGTDCVNTCAVLGVGYIRQSTHQPKVCGDTRHCLIHAWRAFTMFARFSKMADPDALLRACWTITDSELDLSTDEARSALQRVGGMRSISLMRAQVPPLYVLEDMVEHLHDGAVFIDLQELKDELSLGRFADTARLRQLMTRIERDRLSLIPPEPVAASL